MLGGNPGSPQNPNSPATNLLYAGEQFDTDMQQYYLRARYYDQNTGRFNRVDPFAGSPQDPQSLHKYLYCHDNPVNNIDPSGYGYVHIAIGLAILAIIVVAFLFLTDTGSRVRSGLHGALEDDELTAAQRATVIAAGDKLSIFKTPMATKYWEDAFLGEDPLAVGHDLRYSKSKTFLAQVKVSDPKIMVFGHGFFNEEWTVEQRSLTILHELRHSIRRCTDEVAFRAQWIAEVRYRAAYNKENGGKVPIPPKEPTNVVWGEKLWIHEGVAPYIPLEDRRDIVEEFNKKSSIDDNWPTSIY